MTRVYTETTKRVFTVITDDDKFLGVDAAQETAEEYMRDEGSLDDYEFDCGHRVSASRVDVEFVKL